MSSLWRNLMQRNRVESELDDELQAYASLLADEKARMGASPDAARRAALIETGGMPQLKEEVRDAKAGIMLDTFWRDTRFGVRLLLRNPSFTVVAVLALALGIGATTIVFSIVNGVLLSGLPFPESERLAMVYIHFTPQNQEHGTMSIADYLDWKTQSHSFEEPSLYTNGGWGLFDLTGAGESEHVRATAVSAGFFSTLQVKPLLGRVFQRGEDSGSSPREVVLSEGLWRRHFGGRQDIVGQSIRLNTIPTTVVGIMPSSFRFTHDTDLWLNLRINPPTRRGPFPYIGVARLKPGVTMRQAQAEMDVIAQRVQRANPTSYSNLSFPVVSLRDAIVGKVRQSLLVILGGVFSLLLIAVVNVANLMLTRAASREREMAVRLSLGAGRSRLLRQLLVESTVLALVSGLLGLAVAFGGVQLLKAWNPGNLPRIETVHVNGTVLVFSLCISLLTGVLFGLVPALQASRSDLNTSLKEGSRSGTPGTARRRMQDALIVAEIALSLVLLASAGLLLRSFALLEGVNPGFQASPADLLTMRISIGGTKYREEASAIAFYQGLLDRVRSLPGVTSAAISDGLPPDRRADYDTFTVEGETWTQDSNPAVTVALTSSDYLRTLGIPLLGGRYFTEHDITGSELVTVISESMAKRYFGGRDPIGRRMKQSQPSLGNPWMRIVGVVGDVKYTGLDSSSEPAYYWSYKQNTSPMMYLTVRSTIAATLTPTIREAIRELDKDVTVTGVDTMENTMARSVAQPRFRTGLLAIFAALALMLAAIGIYGVVSYSVSQRTHEIGLRMALGAAQGSVLRMVVGQGLQLAGIGVTIGLVGAFIATRSLGALLFSVSPGDPVTFIGVSVLLAAIALGSSLLPAWRGSRIDPLVALRYE
ncbi:MAG TPA: ABC transporter permease [Bryobacteraceae bacterium]|nr:ABC transporter permease [Bryobacteraceae bacterium]